MVTRLARDVEAFGVARRAGADINVRPPRRGARIGGRKTSCSMARSGSIAGRIIPWRIIRVACEAHSAAGTERGERSQTELGAKTAQPPLLIAGPYYLL
jgi:hypothetical protein